MSDYPNSGAVYVNDRKEKPTHPDRTGSGVVTCPNCNQEFEMWLNGWLKDGKKGQFLSLAFKAKEDRGSQAPATPNRHPNEGVEDIVPF